MVASARPPHWHAGGPTPASSRNPPRWHCRPTSASSRRPARRSCWCTSPSLTPCGPPCRRVQPCSFPWSTTTPTFPAPGGPRPADPTRTGADQLLHRGPVHLPRRDRRRAARQGRAAAPAARSLPASRRPRPGRSGPAPVRPHARRRQGLRLHVRTVRAKFKYDDHNPEQHRAAVASRLDARATGRDTTAAGQQRRRLQQVGQWQNPRQITRE